MSQFGVEIITDVGKQAALEKTKWYAVLYSTQLRRNRLKSFKTLAVFFPGPREIEF